MIARFVPEPIAYDGSQLRAHWILRRLGIAGDALVAFRGPCRVTLDEMADLEDVGGPGIAGDDMLHFLWERFDEQSIEAGILRQRLLTAIAADALRDRGVVVRRTGDDLWFDGRKLSISIATRSAVSGLIHFAMNISNSGTPVPTSCLDELAVEPDAFARDVLQRAADEELGIRAARSKVRAKGES